MLTKALCEYSTERFGQSDGEHSIERFGESNGDIRALMLGLVSTKKLFPGKKASAATVVRGNPSNRIKSMLQCNGKQVDQAEVIYVCDT